MLATLYVVVGVLGKVLVGDVGLHRNCEGFAFSHGLRLCGLQNAVPFVNACISTGPAALAVSYMILYVVLLLLRGAVSFADVGSVCTIYNEGL